MSSFLAGIHVNFKSKVNRTAKELNKKVSLPIKKNKWNKGKLKGTIFYNKITAFYFQNCHFI